MNDLSPSRYKLAAAFIGTTRGEQFLMHQKVISFIYVYNVEFGPLQESNEKK